MNRSVYLKIVGNSFTDLFLVEIFNKGLIFLSINTVEKKTLILKQDTF